MFSARVRYAAYPVVIGGVATFVIAWAGMGHPVWPAFAVAALLGIALVAVLERLQPFEREWNRDHDDTATDCLHVLGPVNTSADHRRSVRSG